MKSLSLSTTNAMKARKIDVNDDSSSDEEMNSGPAAMVPKIGTMNRIGKKKEGFSRATEVTLKKEIRRRRKLGNRDSKKDVKRLREKLAEGYAHRREGDADQDQMEM